MPADGEPENVWWLGFDCAHLGDLLPAHQGFRSGYDDRYETFKALPYVKQQTEALAVQLRDLAGGAS